MGKKVNDQEAFDIASSLDLKVWVAVPANKLDMKFIRTNIFQEQSKIDHQKCSKWIKMGFE
jgi:hypothetical protein